MGKWTEECLFKPFKVIEDPMINNAFANYATRVSFNLSLTKTQVFYLWQVKSRNFVSVREGVHTPVAMPKHDVFVPCVRGLIDRGLVVRHERIVDCDNPQPPYPWPYELTEAGEAVYKLLVLAGLVPEIEEVPAAA